LNSTKVNAATSTPGRFSWPELDGSGGHTADATASNRGIAVVDEGKLVGIVTTVDMLRAFHR
jgi:CBS domain-containing protein